MRDQILIGFPPDTPPQSFGGSNIYASGGTYRWHVAENSAKYLITAASSLIRYSIYVAKGSPESEELVEKLKTGTQEEINLFLHRMAVDNMDNLQFKKYHEDLEEKFKRRGANAVREAFHKLMNVDDLGYFAG